MFFLAKFAAHIRQTAWVSASTSTRRKN